MHKLTSGFTPTFDLIVHNCVAYLGSLEVFHFWLFIIFLVTTVISILSIVSFKNLLTRFGLLKVNRRDFYECGFRPSIQKPIKLSIQFIFLCIFFILYDIELIFSFPLVSVLGSHTLLESLTFMFIYFTFIVSLLFDFNRFLTNWSL
jgi:NADH:ubiquinone oxidoreductase subunit 3 (subunit A)